MTQGERERVTAYRDLIALFMTGDLVAKDFQSRFLNLFKNDPNISGGETYSILESIFEEVESFEDDPSIRSKYYTNEDQLRNALGNLLPKLEALLSHSPANS
jgi:hypothetical protein